MHESVRVELYGLETIDAFVSRWRPGHKVRFTYLVKLANGTTFTCQELSMISTQVGKGGTIAMGVPKDQYGNDTKVDGAYTFESKTPDLLTEFTPADDGQSFHFTPGTLANLVALVDVTADVDRGDGVKPHTETIAIAIEAGEAVTFQPGFTPDP